MHFDNKQNDEDLLIFIDKFKKLEEDNYKLNEQVENSKVLLNDSQQQIQ
jgi:hypothetical protein